MTPRLLHICLLCLAIPLAGCLVQHRIVAPPGKVRNRPLLTASKDELIQRLRETFAPIHSFNMRADMSASVGKLYGGELTDYATVRTYVLFLRPADIRVIGLDPVVHSSTIFDMVSTGNDFRVSIPSKERFIIGDNDAPPSSTNRLENMRPAAFLDSLVIAPPSPSDTTLLEDDTDESKAIYILFMAGEEQGQLRLKRAVFFDRYTLRIARQKTFAPSGATISETLYSEWKPYGEIPYPSVIQIRRPIDGYEVTMTVVDMAMNTPEVTPAKFELKQPPDARVTILK